MVKTVVGDMAKRARDLARQAGTEVLKVPNEVITQGAKAVGLEGGYPLQIEKTEVAGKPVDQPSVDQQLAATRAKMRTFAARQKQSWEKTEVQTAQQNQQRVEQIVEAQLGHTPEGKPVKEVKKEQEEKKGGIMGAISGMFKGRKSRRMTGLGQAKKDASGEFGKSHQ